MPQQVIGGRHSEPIGWLRVKNLKKGQLFWTLVDTIIGAAGMEVAVMGGVPRGNSHKIYIYQYVNYYLRM